MQDPKIVRSGFGAFCITVALASAWGVHAQKTLPPLPPAKVVPPPEIISGKQPLKDAKEPKYGDLVMYNIKHEDKTGLLIGTNFRYTEEDTVITGDNARYNRETKFLQATGNLVLDTKKYHITGGKADVDNGKKKLAIITENVVIVMKPSEKKEAAPTPKEGSEKDASLSDEKGKGVLITCDRVESQYKKKYIKMFGNLVFKQKVKKKNGTEIERILFAEHAEYDDKLEVLHLFKPVRGEDTDGQKAKFDTDVFVGTKEGEETLYSSGKMELRMVQEEDEDEDTKETKPSDKKQPDNKSKEAPPVQPKPNTPPPARKR